MSTQATNAIDGSTPTSDDKFPGVFVSYRKGSRKSRNSVNSNNGAATPTSALSFGTSSVVGSEATVDSSASWEAQMEAEEMALEAQAMTTVTTDGPLQTPIESISGSDANTSEDGCIEHRDAASAPIEFNGVGRGEYLASGPCPLVHNPYEIADCSASEGAASMGPSSCVSTPGRQASPTEHHQHHQHHPQHLHQHHQYYPHPGMEYQGMMMDPYYMSMGMAMYGGMVPSYQYGMAPTDPMMFGDPSAYKTKYCRNYMTEGYCAYYDSCLFAHGEHELRELPEDGAEITTKVTAPTESVVATQPDQDSNSNSDDSSKGSMKRSTSSRSSNNSRNSPTPAASESSGSGAEQGQQQQSRRQFRGRQGPPQRNSRNSRQPHVNESTSIATPRAAEPVVVTKEQMEAPQPAQYKTQTCRHWLNKGYCIYDTKCLFAHGEEELRWYQSNVSVLSNPMHVSA